MPNPNIKTIKPSEVQVKVPKAVVPVEKVEVPKKERPVKFGAISAKYESAGFGPGTISSGIDDPGGASYGIHQLSLRARTLSKYISWSKAYQREFANLAHGSTDFNTKWKELAKNDAYAFAADQLEFIAQTHYYPAKNFAEKQGFDLENVGIQEAIFSISVQHGGYKTIIRNARILMKRDRSVENQAKQLYAARTHYIYSLKLSKRLKGVLDHRYRSELRDILELV